MNASDLDVIARLTGYSKTVLRIKEEMESLRSQLETLKAKDRDARIEIIAGREVTSSEMKLLNEITGEVKLSEPNQD